MTTAQKPQVFAARGGGCSTTTQGGYYTGGHQSTARHGRDMPSHMSLKFRQAGQTAAEEQQQRDRAALRVELEAKERAHFEQLKRERERSGGRGYIGPVGSGTGSTLLLEDVRRDHSSAESSAEGSIAATAPAPAAAAAASSTSAIDGILAAFDDADDDVLDRKGLAQDDSDGSGGSVDDDEDDTEELMKELERIRREREEERARKEREAAALGAKESTEAILRGNPLLTKGLASALGSSGATAAGPSAAVRRRFGDDTVFSNTHAHEPETRKRFINDMIRSDFHRNFLKKFIA